MLKCIIMFVSAGGSKDEVKISAELGPTWHVDEEEL